MRHTPGPYTPPAAVHRPGVEFVNGPMPFWHTGGYAIACRVTAAKNRETRAPVPHRSATCEFFFALTPLMTHAERTLVGCPQQRCKRSLPCADALSTGRTKRLIPGGADSK